MLGVSGGTGRPSSLRLVVVQALVNVGANFIKFTVSSDGAVNGTVRATGQQVQYLDLILVATTVAIAAWTAACWRLFYSEDHGIDLFHYRLICWGWIAIGVFSSVAALPLYWEHLGHQSVIILLVGTAILLVMVDGLFLSSTKSVGKDLITDRSTAFYRFITSTKDPKPDVPQDRDRTSQGPPS